MRAKGAEPWDASASISKSPTTTTWPSFAEACWRRSGASGNDPRSGRFRPDEAGAAAGRCHGLGLPLGDPIKVRYADGRRARRKVVEGVYVQLLGRHGTFTAISEPKRETALIGAIILEDLDLLVDCVDQRLIPRDPSGVTSEIE